MQIQTHKITRLSSIIVMISHTITDVSQGAFPVLVPVIKQLYTLTYSQVGFLVFLQSLTASICQPIFGLISDKKSHAWFIPAGVLVSGIAMGSIVWAPSYAWLIILIALSGFGSAIFHPQAMKIANRVSPPKTKGKNVAFFSLGGNLGFAIGSFAIGVLLSMKGGFQNTIWIALPSIMLIPLFIASYKNISLAAHLGEKKDAHTEKEKIPYAFLTTLVGFIFLRSTLYAGISTYTPLYHVDYLHQNSLFTGNYLFIFSAAGVVGTLLGGILSDKFGRKTIIAGSMLLDIPLTFLIPHVKGIMALILAGLLGMVTVASFSPTLVMAQESMKKHMALAGGLTTGLGIGLGGLGATFLGSLADKITLPVLLLWLPSLALLAALFTLFLPGNYKKASN